VSPEKASADFSRRVNHSTALKAQRVRPSGQGMYIRAFFGFDGVTGVRNTIDAGGERAFLQERDN